MQSVESAPKSLESRLWSRLPAHTLFGALGVGLIALVLSHPAVMSLAGLDIARQRSGVARVDIMPTGTITPVAVQTSNPASRRATIRGVIGLRAAIRDQR
ncbi:MAG: hypothetical protein KDJ25_02870 [Rhodoblastus sp.]|nr:hypothetical protein [Rhodoblastus sp.]